MSIVLFLFIFGLVQMLKPNFLYNKDKFININENFSPFQTQNTPAGILGKFDPFE